MFSNLPNLPNLPNTVVYGIGAVLLVGLLVLFLGRRGKKKTPPKKNEMKLASGGGESEMPDVVIKEKKDAPADGAATTTAPRPVYPKLEIGETPVPESDLRYFTPFGPRDTILDIWTKLQSFTATESITLRLMPDDGGAPLLKSSFVPDGTLQSTREQFYEQFAKSLREMRCSALPRSVRKLEMFGIPGSAAQSEYAFFAGKLQMELGGVKVGNVTVRVRATFEPNLGLIARHFTQSKEYLHSDIAVEGIRGKSTITVGFPWTLSSIRLHSEDPRLEQEAPTMVRSILAKNLLHIRENRRSAPQGEDTSRKVSLISDGALVIAMEEGTWFDKGYPKPYLDLEYSAYPQGPLDEMSAGDGEFMRFAESISRTLEPVAAGQVEFAVSQA